jgi:hypothetical protein
MKGMNTSPRLDDILSHQATYLNVQKYTWTPRMRETLFRMGKILQKDVCEDALTEIIRKPRAIRLHSRCLDYKWQMSEPDSIS